MLVKICGLSTPETLEAAIDAGADMLGFVFHPKSPRYVSQEQAAELAAIVRTRAEIVALIVDYDEEHALDLVENLKPDMLQLHGLESVGLTEATRKVTGVKVMKALPVAGKTDLDRLPCYSAVADMILLDAKPPKDAAYPGGHGKPFDWNILKDLDPTLPFMLSGGLTPENVAEAVTTVRGFGVNLTGVDVSSGVESAPGVKDVHKIRDFIQAVRAAG
jgi:phosphoribosylanthranilate isomerase